MNWLTSGFLFLMGFLFFFPAFAFLLYKLFRRIGCKRAEGKCLRIERNRDPDSGSIMIQPLIEFWSAEGERCEVRIGTQYGLKYMPAVGSRVRVYYRPGSQPLQFEVASRGLWEVAGILMLVGLAMMAPALFGLLFS